MEECGRLLRCEMPNLDESMPRWERALSGKVLRPWCHFDVPESDYVSAGRRNAEMPGPSGACALGDRPWDSWRCVPLRTLEHWPRTGCVSVLCLCTLEH